MIKPRTLLIMFVWTSTLLVSAFWMDFSSFVILGLAVITIFMSLVEIDDMSGLLYRQMVLLEEQQELIDGFDGVFDNGVVGNSKKRVLKRGKKK